MRPATYTVHEAKTQLSRLLEKASKGQEVIIARDRTPVAKLIAIDSPRKHRRPGRLKGKITLKPSFFKPMSRRELKNWGLQ